ncbi:MAG: DUF934 domain-containing protein [Burkholderiales bacterium]|nr:DUF934 domain-containing protein [Burkholderiales bacterium]
MLKLINRYGVVDAQGTDGWITYTGDASAIPVGAKVLLPLTEFREFAGTWQKHVGTHGALGVLLTPADDPSLIAGELGKLALIAIDFPAFTDGRGYSTATLLRERYRYIGELRAVGDIQRDQLFLLSRAGFTTFALRDDQKVDAALAAFNDFSSYYQHAADRFVNPDVLPLAA